MTDKLVGLEVSIFKSVYLAYVRLYFFYVLGIRLMVDYMTLTHAVGVRLSHPQLIVRRRALQ